MAIDLVSIADRLIASHARDCAPPITTDTPDFTTADGYAVMARSRARRAQAGAWSVARSASPTARFGRATASISRTGLLLGQYVAVRADGRASLPLDRFELRIEPEVVFKLKAPVRRPTIRMECWQRPNGSRRASRSCRAISPTGSSLRPTPRPIARCMAHWWSARRLRSPTRTAPGWPRHWPAFGLTLRRGADVIDRGVGGNVLDSPALALAHLARLLSDQPQFPPLRRRDRHRPSSTPGR